MTRIKQSLQADYRTRMTEHFPTQMAITFSGEVWDDDSQKMLRATRQTLLYEKVTWQVTNKEGELEDAGLRYGDNPGQEAALYRLINGNMSFGEVETIQPGRWLVSDMELLQSGKHPGKTNITDADNALNILRYFMDEPVVAIMKHNNPCGVAIGNNLLNAFQKANLADRVAAFGGTIALNQPVDVDTAKAIAEQYSEVVVAPDFEEGVMEIFERKKNLRVMKIARMDKLKEWRGEVVVNFKSLIDGSIVTETSYVPKAQTLEDFMALPLGYQDLRGKKVGENSKGALSVYPSNEGQLHEILRKPTEQEYKDMLFGWLVESGITSNSVIYVKDGVTVGIGTGEQDRVGAAKIARDKAIQKLTDRLCFEKYGVGYNDLLLQATEGDEDAQVKLNIFVVEYESQILNVLKNSIMVSDAFFPFRDGANVGLESGVSGIIQPGGSILDYLTIDACNEAGATMIYTAQRSFKH